jgi:arabinogalactan endo-1,4-beta-galactosidase
MPSLVTIVAAAAAAVLFLPSPVLAAPPPFLQAADLSYLPVLDCEGACSPYRANSSAAPESALAILARAGWNAVRLRVWVNPGAGEGPLNVTYANATHVAAMARRVADAGLALWIDFHYSDTWADPGHQTKPAAWVGLDAHSGALADAVYNHTSLVLSLLKAQGTPPAVVAVGNEIDSGMLWPAAGQACSDGGKLWDPACDAWPLLGSLLGAGLRAMRDVLGDGVASMVHTSKGSVLGEVWGPALIAEFFTNVTKFSGRSDWDCAGLSFYPHWGAGNTTNAAHLDDLAALLPGVSLVLAETAYPHEGGPAPAGSEFPYTPAGQLDYLESLAGVVRGVAKKIGGSVKTVGVAWWGGEYYQGPTGAGWTALFDTDGVALPVVAGWGG